MVFLCVCVRLYISHVFYARMLIEILEVKKKQQRGIYQYLTNDDISRGFIYIYI
jgi:hypothetical protein